ncbi:MAG: glycosyltransferase [Desulfomonilaceae bacterium]
MSNPDVAESGIDPIIHYLKEGAAQGRNPNPWFDTSFYMSTHPGVVSVGINPLFHYMILGAHQGYNPHPLFDTSYYVKENPTVAGAGINPLSHFILGGFKLGLIPHPLLKDVSPENYLEETRNRLLTNRMLKLYDVTPAKIDWMKRNVESFNIKPQVTIVIFGEPDNERLDKSLRSISAQAYSYWDLVIAAGQGPMLELAPNSALLKTLGDKTMFFREQRLLESTCWVSGAFLAFLKSGDTLAPDALFELVKELNLNSACDLIYPDEYRTSIDGQGAFVFKPAWSPDLLLETNYIGDFFLLKRALFDSIGGLSKLPNQGGIYDVLLKVSEIKSNVTRLAIPLLRRQAPAYDNGDFEQEVLRNALTSLKQPGEVTPLEIPGTYRVKRRIKGLPLVSIIIPTACSDPDENLFPCFRTIIHRTSYSNYEIIIMDNSHGKMTRQGIKETVPVSGKLRVVEYGDRFNYSVIMNRGAAEARGDYLMLLNDDIEIISPDWIESMIEYAQLEEVGVVGAKLLYPWGCVQHAGGLIVDGQSQTRHAFQHLRDDLESYNGLGSVVRNCSFVTFAAAMIRKDVFIELGGLDERFDVEYNDSDFSLKAGAAGLRVVYTPHAELIHKDASTRSSFKMVKMARNIELFRDKWRDIVEGGDPYYNPNLTLEAPDFGIGDRPVIVEPLWSGTDTLDFGAHYGQGKHPAAQIAVRSTLPLVIVIDSTSCGEMRLWPKEHFARLIWLLSTRIGASVIINDDLRASSSSVWDCDLVIGGLNENINYAASSGIPTLVIWPGQVAPQEFGSFSERAMAVRMAVPCGPCHKKRSKECPYDLKCLNMLWPYKVFEAAKDLLAISGRRRIPGETSGYIVTPKLPDKGIN